MHSQVKVKTEKQATRCEICHKADLFDANTNKCLRCATVEQTLVVKKISNFALLNEQSPNPKSNIIQVIAIIVVILNIILCIMCFTLSMFIGQ